MQTSTTGGVVLDTVSDIRWSAVFAGAVCGAGLATVLDAFGGAIGLAVSSTAPTWRDASFALAFLSGLYLILTALVSYGFGAYVAAPRPRQARFYYWGVPASDMAGWRELGRTSGYVLPGADDPYGGHGTPDDQFTCVVDTSAVAEQAYRALCRHRTQAGDPWYQLLAQQDNWRAVFARSRFVRVHPASQPADAL